MKLNVDNTEQTIISVATGTCGLERGLELAGVRFRVAAYVEIESFIIANLVAAMQTNKMGAAPIWADIKTFPSENFHRKVHGITAGYPCQPFSNAGKRKGTKDERHIFPYILRSIKTIEPVWCYFENVEGHLSMGYDEVYRSLRDIGYKVEAGIFSASEVGAPHERKRLYILAIKMEYANAATLQRIFFANETSFANIGGTSKMAYTNSDESGSEYSNIQRKTATFENTAQRENRKWMWRKFSNVGKDVSYTDGIRSGESLQRTESGMFNSIGFKWPTGRGQQQHSWEHSRTIESGLGCSANGYNFRTDILRALGNGVVPQTASKAFITLLKKISNEKYTI